MKALLQRVRWANVRIDGSVVAEIGPGLLVFLGVSGTDNEVSALSLARKVSDLRIFEDAEGKMNLSLKGTGGHALVVPQFTLLADCSRGHRPGFSSAAPPSLAEPLFRSFIAHIAALGVPVTAGVFGAHMAVSLENDGPVTVMVEWDRGRDDGCGKTGSKPA